MGQEYFDALVTASLSTGANLSTSLVHLDLSRNSFSEADVELLASSFAGCTNLNCLTLASTHLSDRGAENVASLLRGCVGLTSLNLSNNTLGNDGACSLAGAVRSAGRELGRRLWETETLGPGRELGRGCARGKRERRAGRAGLGVPARGLPRLHSVRGPGSGLQLHRRLRGVAARRDAVRERGADVSRPARQRHQRRGVRAAGGARTVRAAAAAAARAEQTAPRHLQRPAGRAEHAPGLVCAAVHAALARLALAGPDGAGGGAARGVAG
eukprot:1956227-Rhodomonas_salina.1